MLRLKRRFTAAGLAILTMAITAGLGPAHTCVSQIAPAAPEAWANRAPHVQHRDQGEGLCAACLLLSLLKSLRPAAAPQVQPSHNSGVVPAQRELDPADLPQLHRDARGPPYTSPDSSTV